MNIREIAIELLQVLAQTPPVSESVKISTFEIALKKIYDQGYKDGGDGEPTVVQEHTSTADKQEPLELMLCEQDNLILKPDQPYIFRLDEQCPNCIQILKRLAR